MSILKLAWKELHYNWRKYILIELLLLLMIFMVMFLSGLANGLGRAVSASIENIDANQFVLSADAENMISSSSLDTDTFAKVKNSVKDDAAELNIQRMKLQKDGLDEKLDITYFAIDPDSFLNPMVVSGDKLGKETHTIVLDELFQDDGIVVGNVLTDTSSEVSFTVVGFTKDAMYGHVPVGYISTQSYADMRIAISPGYQPFYNAIALKGDTQALDNIDNISIVDKPELIKNIPSYQAEQLTIKMILWVLTVISAAILGVFFYIIALQKRKQFGVMKAIGMQGGEVSCIQFTQVLCMAFIGVVCGNALVLAMAQMMPNAMPFYYNQQDAAVVSCAFVIISMLSSLLSTRMIAKIDPITIILGNEE